MLRDHISTMLDLKNRREIYQLSLDIQAAGNTFLKDAMKEDLGADAWQDFLNRLGLSAVPIEFHHPEGHRVTCENLPIRIRKIQPGHRCGREGEVLEQAIVTLTQTAKVKEGEATIMTFRGGCTLVLDLSKDNDKDCIIDYIIVKSIYSQRRFKNQ